MIHITLHDYIKDHPRQLKNLMAGAYAFGDTEIERLINTLKSNQRLDFYYRTIEDLQCDKLSYRIVTK
jgi:hypothetical protein